MNEVIRQNFEGSDMDARRTINGTIPSSRRSPGFSRLNLTGCTGRLATLGKQDFAYVLDYVFKYSSHDQSALVGILAAHADVLIMPTVHSIQGGGE